MKKPNKKQIARIILILLVLLGTICIMYVPAFKSKLTQVLMLFRSMSVESIIGYIKSFGTWAILISFFLMMFQSDRSVTSILDNICECCGIWLVARGNSFLEQCNGWIVTVLLYCSNRWKRFR